jgi:hypothetical protein
MSSPLQITRSEIGSIVGAGLTIMSRLIEEAHSSGSGVNVYVVVLILLGAGDHVPLMPLRLVVGKLMGSPSQMCEIISKSGAIRLLMVRLTGWDDVQPGVVSS